MTEETKIQQEAEELYPEPFDNDINTRNMEISNEAARALQRAYTRGASTRIPLLAEIERLKMENEKLKSELKQHLPEKCIRDWGEVKFCPIRQGEGGKCKHCI